MSKTSRTTVELGGSWQLAVLPDRLFRRHADETGFACSLSAWEAAGAVMLTAAVPGNFELDMLAAGLIGDPYTGDNILQMRALEDRHLLYCREFTAPKAGECGPFLVFDGVDTVADIYVDGQPAGHTDNMLIPHELPLFGLSAGMHTLAVHITPSLLAAMAEESAAAERSLDYCAASLHIRKAAHGFGWDIAPRLLSGGLWRGVRLEYRPRCRIDDVFLTTEELTADRERARLCFSFQTVIPEIERLPQLHIRLEGVCGDSRFQKEWPLWFSGGRHEFVLDAPRVWWPKNRGEQALYTVTASLLEDGQVLDSRSFRFGVRTVSLRREHGEPGREYFGFIVNGEPVFINGTNWVPADAFHSRDAARIDRMLALADDIGCNMLRCWGGNVYEDEPFFDRCDELGILVWQDFAMACGVYPRHARMQEALRREAAVIVKKLRNHPSLCLWAGDNECDTAVIGSDPNDNVLTRRILPEVLAAHDPTRPYLPSSPYLDETDYARGNRNLMEDHLWGSRVYYKGDEYDKSGACFASEMGYHGCPSPMSVRRFISPPRQWPPDDREWVLHGASPEPNVQSCFGYRTELMRQQVRLLFDREIDTLDDFALASQISQMEAYKHFIELFRAHKERRRGILWWNLIDCWPQFSDAVTDYYFTRKLAYFAIREVQKPVAVLFSEPENGCIPLTLTNDTRREETVDYTLYRAEENGLVALLSGRQTVAADGFCRICAPKEPDAPEVLLVTWRYSGGEGRSYFLTGQPPYGFAWLKARLLACGVLHPEGFDET